MSKYNILSPDGFSIRQEDFKTEQEAVSFFFKWQKQYAHQGYYSSNSKRIPLDKLESECEIIKIK